MSGFSLVEMLIAMLIAVTVSATTLGLLDSSMRAFDTQSEVADLQQRLRVSVASLERDLALAGAGLGSEIASVLPYRLGARNPDLPGTFRADTVTVLYVPPLAAFTRVVQVNTSGPGTVVETRADCGGARQDAGCGFEPGMRVILLGRGGIRDVAAVSQVQPASLHLTHAAPLSTGHDGDSVVAQLEMHTYYLKTSVSDRLYQLMHYDGDSTDLPVVDNVVKLEFRYFGMVPGVGLAPMPSAMLTDGPWLPDPTHVDRHDADLLNVRRVRVSVRVQVAAAWLRGPASAFFVHGGTASMSRAVPDQALTFDVAPRNLALNR